jgi:hypothetical protein
MLVCRGLRQAHAVVARGHEELTVDRTIFDPAQGFAEGPGSSCKLRVQPSIPDPLEVNLTSVDRTVDVDNASSSGPLKVTPAPAASTTTEPR